VRDGTGGVRQPGPAGTGEVGTLAAP